MNAKPNDSWFVKKLIALGACSDAIKYAREYRTFPAAWRECEDNRWLFWLVLRLSLISFKTHHATLCAGCNRLNESQVNELIRRRFPADRVSKALRQA